MRHVIDKAVRYLARRKDRGGRGLQPLDFQIIVPISVGKIKKAILTIRRFLKC